MGKRAKPEEIIAKLREIEVRLNQGQTTVQAVRAIGLTEHSISYGNQDSNCYTSPIFKLAHSDFITQLWDSPS